MTFEIFLKRTNELLQAVEALSVIGAQLTILQTGGHTNSVVKSKIDEAVKLIYPASLKDFSEDERSIILSDITTSIRQSLDFLENPGQPPGWAHEDADILNSQGKGSRIIVRLIQQISEMRQDLKVVIERQGNFLDIGTGTGWIAIEAATVWPEMLVTGIDIWKPSLALARQNVAEAGFSQRISIKDTDLQDIEDTSKYSLIWWPSVFMGADIVRHGMPSICRALAPGGFLVLAIDAFPPEGLPKVLAELRLLRAGGYPWHQTQILELMEANGLSACEVFRFDELDLMLVLGRQNCLPS